MSLPSFLLRNIPLLICLLIILKTSLRADVVINEIMYHPPSPEFEREPIELEFIELYNNGIDSVSLRDWAFVRGISITLPDVTLPGGGYAIVAADPEAFIAHYGDLLVPVMGPWEGKLSNSGERLELVDAGGNVMDMIRYADEGDWAERRRGPLDRGHQGWIWYAEHDGLGKSMELRCPALSNHSGQNWGASNNPNGTPGARNSLYVNSAAPLIGQVRHEPAVPTSEDPVIIQATIEDSLSDSVSMNLFYRRSTSALSLFDSIPMLDDGQSSDGDAGDGVFAVELPAYPSGTVIEFYVQASNGNYHRTWPAPTNETGAQEANALFQFDDEPSSTSQAMYRLVLSVPEEMEFRPGSFNTQSDAEMNMTFIAQVGGSTEIRYRSGVRPRGNSSRNRTPLSMRMAIPSDQEWEGLTELNVNSQYSYLQALGMHLVSATRLVAPKARLVQVRINGNNYASNTQSQVHYGAYVHLDPLNSEFVENEFPNDPDGNLYKKTSANPSRQHKRWGVHFESEVVYNNPNWYRTDQWTKQSNSSEEDWSDLQAFIVAINEASDVNYIEEISKHVNIEQWLRYFAILNLINHRETAISNGIDDDYSMYRGEIDTRFVLLPHDMDTLFGLGDTSSTPTATFFQMIDQSFGGGSSYIPQLRRFMNHPVIYPAYLREIRSLLNGILHPDRFDPIVDHVIGHVPEGTRQAIKNFMALRRDYVLGIIDVPLALFENFTVENGYRTTTSAQGTLMGEISVFDVTSVRVQGLPANFEASDEMWQIEGLPLFPGINRIKIEGLNTEGEVVEVIEEDIRRNTGSATELSGTIVFDRILVAEQGPYLITEDLRVPVGLNLIVEPGTTVFFKPETKLIVEGTLTAVGEKYARIRFTSQPTSELVDDLPGLPLGPPKWGGIHWRNSESSENHLSYVDIEYAQNSGGCISAYDSRIVLEEVSFAYTYLHCVALERSSLTARSCLFTIPFTEGQDPANLNLQGKSDQILSKEFPESGEIVIEDCWFGNHRGENAHIRLQGEASDDFKVTIRNNEFRGSEIAHVDLGHVDSLISGNEFTQARGIREVSASSLYLRGGTSWITGNIFSRMDRALTLSEGTEAIVEYNTFYRLNAVRDGAQQSVFAIVSEGGSGIGGLYVGNNIFNRTPSLILGSDEISDVQGTLQLEHNLFSTALADEMIGNLPLSEFSLKSHFTDQVGFADPEGGDFDLLPGSTANYLGPQGQAIGAGSEKLSVVSAGGSVTSADSNEFKISGPGAIAFQYRVDGGAWSERFSVGAGFNTEGTARSTSLLIAGLSPGTHTIEFRAEDVFERSLEEVPLNYEWTISPQASPLRINELLAWNTSHEVGDGRFPDLIEIYNSGTVPVSLNGYSLSDDLDNPLRYRFPAGQTIGARSYLVLIADSSELGFALNNDGEVLSLYRQSNLVDKVEFGPQLEDYSLARSADGNWRLGIPTFGAPNEFALTASGDGIRINEWYAADGLRFEAEFIELYNLNTLPAVLDGLSISDDPINHPKRYQFPEHSFAPANGYLLLSPDPGSLPARAIEIDFQLDEGIESITLEGRSGEMDRVYFQSEHVTASSGRWPDGGDQISRMELPTPGAPNRLFSASESSTLIEWDAVWTYDDLDRDWGTEWRVLDFDDSDWSTGSGVLAREDDFLPLPIETVLRLNPPTTHYFRHIWNLEADHQISEAHLEVIIDDGAVFYLNGEEVTRVRMPGGLIGHHSMASQGITHSSIEGPYLVDPELLVEGENLLAVSVHQDDNSSSDVVFGTRLTGIKQASDHSVLSRMTLLLRNLRITELVYHSLEHPDVEWIELQNVGSEPLLLEGVRFTDGIDFVFPEMTLEPGGRVVVVSNRAAFEAVYGTDVVVAGEYRGRLDNQGESVALTLPEPYEAAIVRFEYERHWYPSTDGPGASLVLRNPLRATYDLNSLGGWRPGYIGGGTPGLAEMVLSSARSVEGSIDEALTYQIVTAPPSNQFEARGLPDGLTLNPTSGVISGVPLEGGRFVVEIEAEGAIGGISTSIMMEITAWGSADHFTWGTIESPQWINFPFEVSLTARDSQGRVVRDFDRWVEVSGRRTSETLSDILITEVKNRSPRFIEVRNSRNHEIDTSDYILAVNQPARGLGAAHGLGVFEGERWVFPDSMAANEVIVISEENGWTGWGDQSDQPMGWVALIRDWQIMDFVTWGYTDQELDLFELFFDGQLAVLWEGWEGNGVEYQEGSTLTMQRTGKVDRNRAMGWSWEDPTPGQDHPSAEYPMEVEERIGISDSQIEAFSGGTATYEVRVGWEDPSSPFVLVAESEFVNASFSEPFLVTAVPGLELTSPSVIEVPSGRQIEYQIRTNYDPYYYGFFNLPNGLTLNENTGYLSGSILGAGTYFAEFYVEAPETNAALLLEIRILTDSDRDGMPNAWETAHGLDPNDASDALSDDDGDGRTAINEYIAGTDPNDPTDRLAIVKSEWTPQGDLQIRWRSVSGKWYRFWHGTPEPGGIDWRLLDVPRMMAHGSESVVTLSSVVDESESVGLIRVEALLHGGKP